MADLKLDPRIAKALGDFVTGTAKAIAAAAADAALDEVRTRIRAGAGEVDGQLEKTQRKVRGARRKKPDVIDAEFEESPRRR